MRRANPGRGEVEVKVDGEPYILFGSFGGLSAMQEAVRAQGLTQLLGLVAAFDPRALLEGIRCLAVEGDTSKVEKLAFHKSMEDVQMAIIKAISGKLEPDPKNGEGATVEG